MQEDVTGCESLGPKRPSGSEAVTSCPSSSNSCRGLWSPYLQGWAVMGDPTAS